LRRAHDVAAADLDAVEPEFARRNVEQPFDRVRGFGATCAAERCGRRRVGQRAARADDGLRDVVDAGRDAVRVLQRRVADV